MSRYSIGIDLAQSVDYTAVAILEIIEEPTGELVPSGERIFSGNQNGWPVVRSQPVMRPQLGTQYHLRHLERFPQRLPYPQIVARIVALVQRPELAVTRPSDLLIAIDATGIGAAVLDLLRAEKLAASLAAIVITGADAVTRHGNRILVPKRELVFTLAVLLENGRLKIAKALPEAKALTEELMDIRVTYSASGHDSYAARAGKHDDLMVATALAAWRAEHPPKPVKVY